MALGGRILTWYEGKWHEGNAPIIGAADHVAWLGTQVFDGARQFEDVRPDLHLNCDRIVASAQTMGLVPNITSEEIFALCEEGCAMFAKGTPVYIRPMMWAKEGTPGIIDPDPDSTGFAICLEEYPIPDIGNFALGVSEFRRPRQDMALTTAKAGSLYANNGRIMADARRRGFNNALSLDIDGLVAETASTNIFTIRDGEIFTPVPNGTFLNGLNRQRIIKLLRADGYVVHETSMTLDDFDKADEMFCTGNIAKIMPVDRYQDRRMTEYPIALKARELYWDFAHSRFDKEAVA